MRIAICDSDAEQCQRLMHSFGACLAKRAVAYTVEQYEECVELLADMEEGEIYDVIFIDLSSGTSRELDAARCLRRVGFDGDIVFTAHSIEFAVDGYEVGASGYLLKPFQNDSVVRLAERLAARRRPRCLTVQYHRHIVRIPYYDLLFIESHNSKCMIHRAGGAVYVVYRQLDDLENELCDERFLRCHQSYLVNMDHIVKADSQFELISGETVGIRQRELRQIRDRYLSYIERLDTLSEASRL